MKLKTRKLSIYDLELLRYWRNKNFVRSQMLSNELITGHNHKKWFENLDLDKNFVFIYSLNSIDVGSVNCKIIDLDKKIFDVGVYCGNSEFFSHPINFLSMIFIHDYAFNELTLQKSKTLIKNNNLSSININKKIGYKYYQKFNNNFDYYTLSKNDYEIKRDMHIKLIKKLGS